MLSDGTPDIAPRHGWALPPAPAGTPPVPREARSWNGRWGRGVAPFPFPPFSHLEHPPHLFSEEASQCLPGSQGLSFVDRDAAVG